MLHKENVCMIMVGLLTIDLRMRVSLHLALFSANSSVLMSFSLTLYLFICSPIISSTHLWRSSETQSHFRGPSMDTIQLKYFYTALFLQFVSHVFHKTKFNNWLGFLRCGLANVLHTLQRIDGVRTAQDTGGKHYGQGVSGHTVGVLLEGNAESMNAELE